MALTIDSGTVLRAFADHPDLFPAVQGDLVEIVRKLLMKQLKATSTTATSFGKMWNGAGADNMMTLIDAMSAAELAGLVKKIDPFSAYAKAGDAVAARAHIADLASGRATPSDKSTKIAAPKKPKAAAKPPASKIGDVLGSKVHSGSTRRPRSKS